MSRRISSPGEDFLAGVGLYPLVAAQDTAAQMAIHPVDSLVDKTLLGDRITPIIQFVFQQEPWIMWGGVVLGGILALAALWWLWPRRGAGFHWARTRSRNVKLAFVGGTIAALMIAAGVGYSGFHFMETDRRFCNGCHIFVPSGQAWVKPDTGYYSLVPKLEGKHDTINCHTCHALQPLKEVVKMTLWMSGVREDEIPEHGRVPRTVCESCHIQGAAKETWQAIATTAGHRTHLESDSSALKDSVQCLTCHARTAHRFQPADSTCVQKGCHLTDETNIVLGKMRGQSDLHCTLCHEFARPVALLATRDSAAGALRPGLEECFSCHQMKDQLPTFSAIDDPHGGTCGMCHNPHDQKLASDTRESCATSGCHADWKTIPFHVGANHRAKGEQCVLCHDPHASRADASDCTGCHESVRQRPGGAGLRPPLPFDTLKALQSAAPPHPDPVFERPNKVKGDAPPGDDPPERELSALPPLPADSFSHPTHKKLACLTCHTTTAEKGLTFEAPRGCQICHHQAPEKSDCVNCHAKEGLSASTAVTFSIAAASEPARERTVGFAHTTHDSVSCTACHGQRVTLAVVDSVRSCQGCHVQHHEVDRDCASCHRTAQIAAAHARPIRTHVACDACHTTERITGLTPTRSFCLACHEPSTDHYPDRQCSTCHLQSHPKEYQGQLLKAWSAR